MPQQRWAVSADGGYLANPSISERLRYTAQPLMKFDEDFHLRRRGCAK